MAEMTMFCSLCLASWITESWILIMFTVVISDMKKMRMSVDINLYIAYLQKNRVMPWVRVEVRAQEEEDIEGEGVDKVWEQLWDEILKFLKVINDSVWV